MNTIDYTLQNWYQHQCTYGPIFFSSDFLVRFLPLPLFFVFEHASKTTQLTSASREAPCSGPFSSSPPLPPERRRRSSLTGSPSCRRWPRLRGWERRRRRRGREEAEVAWWRRRRSSRRRCRCVLFQRRRRRGRLQFCGEKKDILLFKKNIRKKWDLSFWLKI